MPPCQIISEWRLYTVCKAFISIARLLLVSTLETFLHNLYRLNFLPSECNWFLLSYGFSSSPPWSFRSPGPPDVWSPLWRTTSSKIIKQVQDNVGRAGLHEKVVIFSKKVLVQPMVYLQHWSATTSN